MKAIIKQVTSYAIEIDGKEVGTFKKGDTWNGMTEFKGESGVVVVGGFDVGVFGNLFNEPVQQELTMITASPKFISDSNLGGITNIPHGKKLKDTPDIKSIAMSSWDKVGVKGN